MIWEYWLRMFLDRHCGARGLSPNTLVRYEGDLTMFRNFVRFRLGDKNPDTITARDVLLYVNYLRTERDNGPSAVNRHVTVLKGFYRAMVAMNYMDPNDNPMKGFCKIKSGPRKLPEYLTEEEIDRLLSAPKKDTVIGIRDRAILGLFYGTGIRATEAATLRECDVDFEAKTIKVRGKGGHERVVRLGNGLLKAMAQYKLVRGEVKEKDAFFRGRNGRGMTRHSMYERVRVNAHRARIKKRVSPHRLRHTCATHLMRTGINVVTIQELLGHRYITSTQIYLHVTGEQLREAASVHPVELLLGEIEELLPDVKLPFQRAPQAFKKGGGAA